MDLELLKTFCQIAHQKNIHEVAETLYVSQPTVISRIRVLEEDLGCTLFYREKGTVQLTTSGMQFLTYAEKTLELIDRGMKEVQHLNPSIHPLELASVPSVATYILPSLLKSYRQLSPHVGINVRTSSTSTILDWVTNGKIELGLIRGPLEYKGVTAMTLFSDEMIPIVDPKHPWVKKEYVTPEDFLGETVLAFSRRSFFWKSVMNWFKENGVTPHIAMEFDHIETIKQMIYSLSGTAFVPAVAVRQEIMEGRLKTVALHPPMNLFRDTIVIRHRTKPLSSQADDLWQSLEKYCKKSNEWSICEPWLSNYR